MNKKTEMDRKIFDIYLKSKNMVIEFYNKAMKKIQKVQTSNEHEENIKNQFITQLAEFSFQLKIKYSLEHESFVEKIEDKLHKLISPYDGEEVGDDSFIKYYKLRIVEDICDFYRFKADEINEMQR
jgi:hypothetical protein